jgi:predicted transcriptional regulator
MSLTVRLSAKTERALNAMAKRRRQTRSDIVREAIEQYTSTRDRGVGEQSQLDAWADVIGSVRTTGRPRTTTTGEAFRDLIRGKARARRPR